MKNDFFFNLEKIKFLNFILHLVILFLKENLIDLIFHPLILMIILKYKNLLIIKEFSF